MTNVRKAITFQNSSIQKASQGSSIIRAKSFKVATKGENYSQYVDTIKAYALAGMPFSHIANAGEYIGDLVEKGEIDTALIKGWQEKAGEIAEEESKILAWQNRGDVISITHQLPASTPTSGQEVVPVAQNLTQQNQPQNINVLEGIAVFNQGNFQLENNPYLRAPADLKKAA